MTYNSTSWKPGQSGNPKGKAKGLRDKRQFFNEELMISYHESGDAFRVMEVIKNHALQGNMKACALFCQYVLFRSESAITINHETGEKIDKILTTEQKDQIRKIAEIIINSDSNESK